MANLLTPEQDARSHPLDLVEQIIANQDWPFDRFAEDELAAGVNGRWCDFNMAFTLREDIGVLHFTCSFDLKVPLAKRTDGMVLCNLMNERMWLGHFELNSDTQNPLFRHSLPFHNGCGLASVQLEDLIEVALNECERFYPALQFVLWAGKSPDEAVASALLDVMGEA